MQLKREMEAESAMHTLTLILSIVSWILLFPSIQTLMARGSPKPKLGFHTSQLAFLHLRKRSIRNKYPTIISTSMQVLHV